jgi:hypothetical protein
LWIQNKIRPKWELLLGLSNVWEKSEVRALLADLSGAIRRGMDPELARKLDGVPADVSLRWSRLAYTYITAQNLTVPMSPRASTTLAPVQHKQQIRKAIKLPRSWPLFRRSNWSPTISLRRGLMPMQSPRPTQGFSHAGRADVRLADWGPAFSVTDVSDRTRAL